MSSNTNELDDIFNDVSDLENEEDPIDLTQAAQRVAQDIGSPPPSAAIPQPVTHEKVYETSPPPSAPIETEEQKIMDKYNQEKEQLFKLKDQLNKLAHSDKSGNIIRNFDLSQLLIKVGDEVDRLNGLVTLRSLKARCKAVKLIKDNADKKQGSEVTEQEELADCLYEVWGIMEDGSVGLTSSYSPSMILCVISLNSGYDLPPEE